jgi:hypothetical protein
MATTYNKGQGENQGGFYYKEKIIDGKSYRVMVITDKVARRELKKTYKKIMKEGGGKLNNGISVGE